LTHGIGVFNRPQHLAVHHSGRRPQLEKKKCRDMARMILVQKTEDHNISRYRTPDPILNELHSEEQTKKRNLGFSLEDLDF
jgi:hypothetical protein